MKKNYFLVACVALITVLGCSDYLPPYGEGGGNHQAVFNNKSNLEPLVKVSSEFNFVKAYSLISSSDVLGGFQLAGSADGAGFVKEGGNYVYVVNNEDHFAVARVTLDKNLTPIKGDYLLNSGVADFARQCSGTMWDKTIHGGNADLFLSASESGAGIVKGIDPHIVTPTPTADFNLPALGKFSWENAVPLPKNAYKGKTVIIGGDDDSSGSEGQLILYLSDKGDADLTGGDVYVLRMKDAVAPVNEGSLDFNTSYDVEFVKISDPSVSTINEYETASVQANALQFMRVEDLDYGKGSDAKARSIFFAVTGRGPGAGTYNDWGTVYRLDLDSKNPKAGKLKQIISGNTNTNKMDGNLATLQSPDNICVTENFVYIQEDPNSFSRNHASYIYQTNYNGSYAKVVLELVEKAELSPDGVISDGGEPHSGEFGSLIDISDKIGVPNVFLLALQPHYWTSDSFKGLDGHIHPSESNQGSQVVILKGLPR